MYFLCVFKDRKCFYTYLKNADYAKRHTMRVFIYLGQERYWCHAEGNSFRKRLLSGSAMRACHVRLFVEAPRSIYLKEIRKRCVIFIFVPKRKLLGNYEVYCNILTTSLLSGILEKGSRYGKRLRYMQIRIQFVQLYKINVGLLFFPNLYLFQFAKRAIIKHES